MFRSDVVDTAGADAGEVVRVVDTSSRPLGTAHYSTTSQIALRMLSPNSYAERIAAAAEFRQLVVRDSTAFRLVHAEADLLPALIIDRYGDCFSVQALSQGMDRALPEIVAALVEQFHPQGILARNDAAVRTQESLPREIRLLHGDVPDSIELKINGLTFHADLRHGQKTGIFLDQRENYPAAARYATERALDCFTSTGGFALHLAKICEHVEAVDSSATALATAERNRSSNSLANVEFREADIFDLLSGYASARKRFDCIVLDPPAFAKSRQHIEGAMRGYRDINLRALRLLGPGGVLVTCSCSHHVSEAALLEVVAQAALDARRTLRVLERRTQAQDHPILLTIPETHYLKCLILQVL
ncbi:MAG: class I SAM-dependent rRNA methyltransferase [Acidobacteriota bacterium]|nr:class I SAM-dependent rRNA methyltransferase [Acidobacteriota bacterium]